MNKTVVSTALFGPETLPHLQFLPEFAGDLEAQSFRDCDVVVHATGNLFPLITRKFEEHAPAVINEGRLYMRALRENGLNNLSATVQRMDYFVQTPEGARYDRIACLDVDDKTPARYIETMRRRMDDYNADILAADFHMIDQNGDSLGDPYLSRRYREGQLITFDMILDGNFFGLSNTMVRPDALRAGEYRRLAALPDEAAGAPDWSWILAAAAKGQKLVFTCEGDAHIQYRQSPGVNLSGILVPDVQKAFRVKSALYPHFAAMNLPAPHGDKVRERAAQYEAMKNEFFAAGHPTPAYEVYEAEAKLAFSHHTAPVWWEAAPLAKFDVA